MENERKEIIPVIEPKVIYALCEFELSNGCIIVNHYWHDSTWPLCIRCGKNISE